MEAAQVGQGVIAGGWNYVIAAYAISWVVLLAFTALTLVRAREATR